MDGTGNHKPDTEGQILNVFSYVELRFKVSSCFVRCVCVFDMELERDS